MARHKLGTTKKRKHSTTKKSHHRRRRSVGAAGNFQKILMDGAAVGAGVVAAREISILAGGLFPGLMGNPVMVGVGQFGLGLLAVKMAKNGLVMYMGLGAMGEGVMTGLNGAGIIGGPPQTITYPYLNRRGMGDPRIKFVAGPQTRIGSYPNNFSAVAGPNSRRKRYTS